MSILVGPVNSLGHPFTDLHEVPRRIKVGDHTVYAFGQSWLYTDLEIVPDEKVEACILWDPGWMRDGTFPGAAIDEIGKIRTMADEWDCPVFGLASDWFATWGAGGGGMYGMVATFEALDGVVIDPVGAAALRSLMPSGAIEDPADYRHRVVIEMDDFLHAGRLPTAVGLETVPAHADRSIDVCMISNVYPNLVVFRSYYIEAAKRICDANGWSFVRRHRVSPEEMEQLYLDSKVILNVSLGTQPNCRVYEALACGATLVTDSWNIASPEVPGFKFLSVAQLEYALGHALNADAGYLAKLQKRGREWACEEKSPINQWTKVLDAVLEQAAPTAPARAARIAREQEMNELAKTAPRTKDGRPVILV